MTRAQRKRVLVTGANSGIGLASILELARRGFDAAGTVRSRAKAGAVRDAAREAGVEVRTALLDVTDADACRRVVEREEPFALVNNAGTSFTGAIEDVDDAAARQALETMTLAPMRLARLAVPHMRERGGGRIVNVSSIYGRTSTPLTGWYQAAKQALEGVSDALRMEVATDGIHVILVEPGAVETGLWDVANEDLSRRGSRYEQAYRRARVGIQLTERIRASADQVARVIATAISARNPRPRYLVGVDAQWAAFLDRLAPTWISDRVKRLPLGL
jgi:NAD(P)-dependent dehydrogenase (short-subunit alcohol dehydrogenase family)